MIRYTILDDMAPEKIDIDTAKVVAQALSCLQHGPLDQYGQIIKAEDIDFDRSLDQADEDGLFYQDIIYLTDGTYVRFFDCQSVTMWKPIEQDLGYVPDFLEVDLVWHGCSADQMQTPLFEKLYSLVSNWDIAVPGIYDGYMDGDSSHVRAILDIIDSTVKIEGKKA